MEEKERILKLLQEYKKPKRIALSKKYPLFKKPIIFLRKSRRSIKNKININISRKKSCTFFTNVIAKHQSVLMRKLGTSDQKLQIQKITNLKKAIEKIDGIIIPPQKIFSFWETVGRISIKKGYVDGMLLSDGKVVEGLGGGLCQLSNLLYWLFLHSPFKILERHHHSHDVFPDSGRVLPFGSGATILHNFVDLKAKNISQFNLQIKLRIDEKYLKGKILSSKPVFDKFHIYEKNHFFIKDGNHFFRYNEIWRELRNNGTIINNEKIITNFAPVLYKVDSGYLKKHNYKTIIF